MHADVRFVNKVLDIPTTEVCFVIGTIYADLPLKPNILDEITEEVRAVIVATYVRTLTHYSILFFFSQRYLVKPPPRPKYVSDKDKFVLEDESGRVTLVGDKVSQETLVTGVVVAVLGIQQGGGELLVHDICFAGVAPQKPLPSTSEDTFVALVSGLHIGAATTGPSSPKILVDYLTGCLGGPADQERAAKIAHVIIAGNSLTSVGSDNAAAAAVAVAVAVAAAAATSANGDDKMDAVGSSSSENTAQQQQQVLGKKSSTPDSHAIPLGPMVELDQVCSCSFYLLKRNLFSSVSDTVAGRASRVGFGRHDAWRARPLQSLLATAALVCVPLAVFVQHVDVPARDQPVRYHHQRRPHSGHVWTEPRRHLQVRHDRGPAPDRRGHAALATHGPHRARHPRLPAVLRVGPICL